MRCSRRRCFSKLSCPARLILFRGHGVRVRDGKVLVSLAANADRTRWGSVIADKRPELTLVAPKTLAWTERWRADVSPIWHLDTRGLAVVHHQDPNGRWLPEWHPWPGEALTLVMSRPGAIEGPTLALKASRLAAEIGQRATDSTLGLALESSQGGQLPSRCRRTGVS
jgi:hypothetical protein